MHSDYLAHDAIGLATLVRERKAAARTARRRDRLAEAVNGAINAIVLQDYEAARQRAAATPDGGADAPFAGVPYLVKDLGAAVAGLPLSMGSRHYRYFVPADDSPVIARSRAAGLNVFGKTNTSEIGQMPYTEPELFGACRNPWNLDHTPGGSSGGAAAAVAAGIVPLAHASDGGGSIRIPASCCGLFGLKPSRNPVLVDLPSNGELVVQHGHAQRARQRAAARRDDRPDLATGRARHVPRRTRHAARPAADRPRARSDARAGTRRRHARGARRRGRAARIARPPCRAGDAARQLRARGRNLPHAMGDDRRGDGARRAR